MNLNRVISISAAAALLVPAGAIAAPGKDKSKPVKDPKPAKAKMHVFKGTLVSADAAAGSAVVHVLKGNKRARAFKDQDVTFTVTRVNVADTNGDGKRDLADVAVGNRVHVQAKLVKDAAQPFVAKKLIDQGAPEAPETE